MGKLFLLFALLPIAEISLLIHVGGVIGGWNTVAIVILTAIVGATLVRQQGLATLIQAQQKLQAGQLPATEMAEGLMLVIAGVMLVTPGFITDTFGLLLCLPFIRPVVARAVINRMQVQVVNRGTGGFSAEYHAYQRTEQNDQDGEIIEGEYVNKDDTHHLDKH